MIYLTTMIAQNIVTDCASAFYVFMDEPTPLPLFPDDGEMQTLPYDGDAASRNISLTGDANSPDQAGESDASEPQFSADDAVSYALLDEKVISARAFIYDGYPVVAVLTTPFYLKSERDAYKKLLEERLSDALGAERIYITFDVEVYRKISDDMTENEMRELFALASRG